MICFFKPSLFSKSHVEASLTHPRSELFKGKKNVILIPICETIKNHFSYQTKILHQLHDEHIAKNCSNSNYFVKSGNIHAHRIHVLHGSCGCVLSIIPFTPNLFFNDLNCVPNAPNGMVIFTCGPGNPLGVFVSSARLRRSYL